MELSQPVTDIIRKRFSCRTYTGQPLAEEDGRQLAAAASENRTGPFGTTPRFRLVAATPGDMDTLKSLGTYGFIRGASGFIIGAAKDLPYNLEDYGYVMESNILYAAGLGLGTCWLGGTFNRSSFSRAVSAAEDESVPAVVATGYIASKRRLFETVVRWGAGADNRKPWGALFFESAFDTPLSMETAGEWATALEMVRLGPSASNRQPWCIVRETGTDRFHFYLKRSKGYATRNQRMFNLPDLQRVDMGIAMCHFELSVNEAGKSGGWRREEPAIGPLPELTEYVATWAATRS